MACSLLCVIKKSVVVMKVPKEYSVGTPLPGCPTALPSIADTSGEVSLQENLSLFVDHFDSAQASADLYIVLERVVRFAPAHGLLDGVDLRLDGCFIRIPAKKCVLRTPDVGIAVDTVKGVFRSTAAPEGL